MSAKTIIAATIAGGAAYVLLKAAKFGGAETQERVIYVTSPGDDEGDRLSGAQKALGLFGIGLGLLDTFSGGTPLFGGWGGASETSGGDGLPQVIKAGYNAGSGAGPGGVNFASYEAEHGLPAGYLSRTAQIESAMNPNAKNPKSSAGGLFQFINSTAQQYGLINRYDPTQATDAASRLAADNARQLRRVLGRDPTAAELYLAHQQGGAGASKLLRNPNARAADVVGANAVRLNGGSQNMTAREFAGLWIDKFNKGF